jgi:dUTP pyrophosphatase
MLKIKFKKLSDKAILPRRAKEGDAGYDVFSSSFLKIAPFERKIIPLGFAIEIPQGYYGHIYDRSGNAAKRGIHIMAGVIDSGYRGEVGVVAINLNGQGLIQKILASFNRKQDFAIDKFFGFSDSWEVKEGDAVAQIIFRQYEDVDFEEVRELSATDRGQGGYGHTG